ncbi:guanylate kinase [Altericista sp. CCNU0014]|uniref:guanylate kinase n=1 Tax=Altericista sp. CCNU0014 TaxID=3082949 RepID=UPI00384C4B84
MSNPFSESKNLIVFTGPSGVGKGTVLRAILGHHPELHLSVSATTRSPRPGEVEGKHYYFLTRSQFEAMVAQDELLEWAEFAGNLYGTPRQPLLDRIAQGQRVILEIELEGARQVRQTAPDALQIFIAPPSLEELETRIRKRGQDTDAAIARRLARAKVEIASAHEFDVQIVNDNFERTVKTLEEVLFPNSFGAAGASPSIAKALR